MQHLFVPYITAKELKNKGFNEPCLGLYNRSAYVVIAGNTPVYNSKTEDVEIICAPLFQQVVDWFRDNHNMTLQVSKDKIYPWYGCFEKYEQYYELANSHDYYDCWNKVIINALKLI